MLTTIVTPIISRQLLPKYFSHTLKYLTFNLFRYLDLSRTNVVNDRNVTVDTLHTKRVRCFVVQH